MGNAPSEAPRLQSVPLPGTAVIGDPATGKLGSSAIYRSATSPERLIDHIYDGVTTVYDNYWKRGRVINPNGPCLGWRPPIAPEEDSGDKLADPPTPVPPAASSSQSSTSTPRFVIEAPVGPYKWYTYVEAAAKIEHFASGLVRLGLKKGDHLGLFAINNVQWTLADQACYTQGFVTVALYDTFGQDAVEYIINEAKINTIVCTLDKIRSLFTASERCPGLKTIIQIEGTGDEALIQEAKDRGLELLNFAMVEANGALHPSPHDPPVADDLCTIMYTSGTTGMPKGVLLTHRCVIAALSSTIQHGIDLNTEDVHLSYLPLAHIFERLLQYAVFSAGASMGFYQGNVRDKLFDDIKELRPTIFASVPRLFSRVFDKISQRIETTGGLSKFLFQMAYSSKLNSLEEGNDGSSPLWDSLVFEKTRERLGGRVRYIVTGSAPISSQLFRFLQICFSCSVLQGYGLTETSAGATLTHKWDRAAGHTGAILPCCEIKLEDIPDMKYFSTDNPPRGEVCIRGPNVFHGYYEQPEKTREAIDEDGWFHTGDVGLMNPNGTLTIIDRKKNIFKLSQGEYVAAEKLESCLLKNKYVAQIFVYGDSLKSTLVAVIVPDPDTLIPWAKSQAIPNADNLDAICRDENVIKHVLKSLGETGREWQFKGFEFIRAVHLEPEAFSVEQDLLTPTHKNKRPQLTRHYHNVFDQLYASIPE